MKILYSVNGEGMGHATRSSVVIDYLKRQGHEIAIIGAGKRPLTFLRDKFGDVTEVQGLHMVYRNNKVRRLRTAFNTVLKAKRHKDDLKIIKALIKTFHPAIVITDFDYHGYLAAKYAHVPLISIDNVEIITQGKFTVAAEDLLNYELNYLVAKLMVPRADYYFITSFADIPLRRSAGKRKVQLVPPILRDDVFEVRQSKGKHIVVYQTSDSYNRLWPMLAKTNEKYIIYNAKKPVSTYSHLEFKPFSKQGIIKDLALSKAVIVNGGFNVITEALYFQKPILSIPVRNFYEQKLNGLMIEREGFGLTYSRLTLTRLQEFIARLDEFQAKTNKITFDQKILFEQLDSILESLTSN